MPHGFMRPGSKNGTNSANSKFPNQTKRVLYYCKLTLRVRLDSFAFVINFYFIIFIIIICSFLINIINKSY